MDQFTPEESERIAYYNKLYNDGEYVPLMKAFCHEGYHFWKNGDIWTMGICSFETEDTDSKQAIKKVADFIIHKVNVTGWLGC